MPNPDVEGGNPKMLWCWYKKKADFEGDPKNPLGAVPFIKVIFFRLCSLNASFASSFSRVASDAADVCGLGYKALSLLSDDNLI